MTVDRVVVRFPGPQGPEGGMAVGTDTWFRAIIGTEPALQFSDITRDDNGVIASAFVVWPDGTTGEWTTTDADDFGIVDFSVTYGDTKVVTATVTRDADGLPTDNTVTVTNA